jgi:hypothetical protein
MDVYQRRRAGWREDLRMPLTQEVLAQETNTTTDEIIVGVYALRERDVEQTTYSAAKIRAARSSLEDLLRSFVSEIPSSSSPTPLRPIQRYAGETRSSGL